MEVASTAGFDQQAERRAEKKPWESNPNWGFSAELASGQPETPLLNFPVQAGEFQRQMAPQSISCMLSAEPARPFPSTINAHVIAKITAGSGASYQRFEMDVNRGTQFSVICNTLTISIRWADPAQVGPLMRVTATLGFGYAIPTFGANTYRTLTIESIADGGNAIVDVPMFAANVRIIGPNPPTLYNVSNLYNALSGALATDPILAQIDGSEAGETRFLGRSFQLPSGATNFQVVNNSGSLLGDTQLQFGLAM